MGFKSVNDLVREKNIANRTVPDTSLADGLTMTDRNMTPKGFVHVTQFRELFLVNLSERKRLTLFITFVNLNNHKQLTASDNLRVKVLFWQVLFFKLMYCFFYHININIYIFVEQNTSFKIPFIHSTALTTLLSCQFIVLSIFIIQNPCCNLSL